ncbi:MAG: DUF362 domain-containing protein [Planctomycetota bacterium]|jgi:uncharacterized protein (DUF362 family)
MGILNGARIEFEESMSGYVGKGETDPAKGLVLGQREKTEIRFDVRISIDDLGSFLKISHHEAALTGTVTSALFGGTYEISDGIFNLFSLDPATGIRQMVYAFRFTAGDGRRYYLHGHKEIHHTRGKADVVEDMTRLFTIVYQGDNEQAPIYGAGELRFQLEDVPSLLASIEVIDPKSLKQRFMAYLAFISFVCAPLRDEYLKNLRVTYETEYENLVLSGVLNGPDGPRDFFLVSGVHEKGFPWGDGESFWDVILAIGDGSGGYLRYGITDHALEGLKLDVEHGKYRYSGTLFTLEGNYAASFSQMRAGASHLTECKANFEIDFDARAKEPVSYPLPVVGRFAAPLVAKLREALPSEHPLGMHIIPHTVTVRSGKVTIKQSQGRGTAAKAFDELQIDTDMTFGEAERSTFQGFKEPTLLYGYICALLPGQRAARVQIHTRTLRDERELWAKDQLDRFLGKVLSRIASAEMLMEKDSLKVKRLAAREDHGDGDELFTKLADPIIEINNDHFPTAVFQRRIVKVRDPSGAECLALEEDMSRMRLDAINSDKKVTVASIRDQDKFTALDRVLEETDFKRVMEMYLSASGKSRAQFSIVIKPNFMFAYNKRDHTTYTDPELVGHLVKRIREEDFERITIVEAQSTYGEYFYRRSVSEMAEYLNFDGKAGYRIVDMTEDAKERRNLGPHLGYHPVSTIWRGADFRISFAKNKTHAYAYYTLTLKNIYGALPLANKFKEYHCTRDIYHTAIEYLAAFPVHFGLVDAYISADGPFGIFADTRPNLTHTIIGGEDLVAVDWVAATKMGIDPMISKYMRLAVKAFGKPEIELIGDGSMYRPWLNVPVALTLFTHKGLDANYHFGNLFYTGCAQMDKDHFKHKSNAIHIKLLRKLTLPIRRMFFKRSNEKPTWYNRLASRLLNKLGY